MSTRKAMVALALTCVAAAAVAGPADAPKPDVIRVPGSDVVVRIWDGPSPRYAVSLDGRDFSTPRTTSYELRLRHGVFDPMAAAPIPAVEPGFEAGDDTNLYIVQFLTHPLEVYRDNIAEAGGVVRAFLPRHSHVVEMTPDVVEVVQGMPFVRWIGPFHPAYRLEEAYLDDAERGDALFPMRKFNIMVFESGMTQKATVADRIRGRGGIVDRAHAGKRLLEATLTPTQLFEVVRWDEVLFVDTWSPYEADMDRARQISGADFLAATPEGFTGYDVRGEVLDQGFNLAHLDFASRPLLLHTPVDSNSHGAATSGIVFGDGSGDPNATGILPHAQGIVADWDIVSIGQPRYDHTGELVEEPYNAVFQTASVGSARTTFYTTISADTDHALFDFDIVHTQSQSNAGDQNSRPQAWAKNIISVGGVRHFDTLSKDDDFWGAGGSTGPATDDRIKPDLCHFYDSVRTVTTGGPNSYTSSFGGTSAATPIVAGYVGLFFQMWSEGIFGNPVDPSGSVFENRPHMTTAKAMMINTAAQYDWTAGGPNADITRYRQGWGLPDLMTMYEDRFKFLVVDETDLVTDFTFNSYAVTVDPGENALYATLVFADPPGAPFSVQHRINDLTLHVTSPSGVEYWGNHGLIDGLWSTPGGGPSDIDTVENVFIRDPEAGVWTIDVAAFEIIEDGHVETSELDADYALVVRGVQEELPPLFVRLLEAVPDLVAPETAVELEFEVADGAETIVPGSEQLHYRFDDGGFTAVPLVHHEGDVFIATIPAASCGDAPSFYVSALGDGGTTVTNPVGAPDATHAYDVGVRVTTYTEDFENESGWTVESFDLQDGAWERAIPAGGGDRGDPPADADGSGYCFLTDNADGDSDVDGGPTRLTSPRLDATLLAQPSIGYARWFTNDDDDEDSLEVEISNDDGQEWVLVESVLNSAGWVSTSFRIADYVVPNDQIRLRFSATDNPSNSVTEAGVDAVTIHAIVCDTGCAEDLDGSGAVDFADILPILAAWGQIGGAEDLDGSGVVDVGDIVRVLAAWGPCGA